MLQYRLRRTRVLVLLLAAFLMLSGGAEAARPTSSRCNPRKQACTDTTDTTPPTITIGAPSEGSSAAGSLTISGSATDDTGLSRVEVRIDAGAFKVASGTSSWTFVLDTTTYADGAHTITARAVDAAGGSATDAVTISVANTSADPGPLGLADDALSNPAATQELVPLGRGRMATSGAVSVLLYEERFAHRPYAYVRDATTGAHAHVSLPYESLLGWAEASYVLTPDGDLWVMGGKGPMYLRHFRLSGSPLPTSATLLSTEVFGDSDSRPGDVIRLASGALVMVWHQQGATTPQGHRIAYRSTGGAWTTTSVSFLPTRASKDDLVQHPGDGSVWLFNSPDAWSSIGALHMTESPGGLQVDWADQSYIDSAYGEFDADPENPDLAVAADPSTGEIVLAYQSARRQIFGSVVAGSWPAIARIRADGGKSFMHLPVWVERVTRLGLVVVPGEVWLVYQPLDTTTYTFNRLAVSRYRDGGWSSQALGDLPENYGTVAYGEGRVEFGVRLTDARTHSFWS